MISELKVVVIGGGTGLSVLLRGLKHQYSNLTAIVTVADDGGGSGVLREDLGMLPPGDIRSCILALANTEPTMEKLLQYRFKDGRLKGQSFGNLFIAALDGISENFQSAVKKTSDIFAITGKVLPVSNQNVNLVAVLDDDSVVVGESNIPKAVINRKAKIKQIKYDQGNVKPIKEVPKAIIEADIILIGPGSLFTSIIPSLIIKDVQNALFKTSAKIGFVTNLMTQKGETDGFSISDHIIKTIDHLGKNIYDFTLVNNGIISDRDKERYHRKGAEFLKVKKEDEKFFNSENISLIEENIVEVVKGYVRHDSKKIGNIIEKLIDIKIYK